MTADPLPPPATASLLLGPYAAVFAPAPQGRRAEAVARRLGDSIALGLLPHDCPLPAESDLADRFGVAVVTVREALATLRADGLVRTTRGRRGGSFVVAPADGGRSALRNRLAATPFGDWRDLADHYATISGGAARLAADRADEADLARLRTLVDRGESAFHLDLAAAAQSPRLTREEMALQGELGPVLWLAHRVCGDETRARTRHTEIVDAVTDGDGERARTVAEAHVGELFAAVRDVVAEDRRAR